MKIVELIEKISSKDDFVNFLNELNHYFAKEGHKTWENVTLDNYLQAMESFVSDSTDTSLHGINFTPSWKLFAIILYTAGIYE